MLNQQESQERKKGHLAFGEARTSLFSLVLRQNLGFHQVLYCAVKGTRKASLKPAFWFVVAFPERH